MRLRPVGVLALLTVGLAACQPPPPPPPPAQAPPPDGPSLVLLLVVDQLSADYLERFGPLLQGGLARLMREGIVFTDAHQAHSVTETAPGHATLATGVRPRRHGVIANGWVDRSLGRTVTAVADPTDGASPRQLLTPALGDWVKAQYPEARVFAASMKDRSAIFLGGLRPDAAFWYNASIGGWRSSPYYLAELPAWVEDFNARRDLDAYLGTVWAPLPVDAAALEEVAIERVDLGPLAATFPHPFGGLQPVADPTFYAALTVSPWLDVYLARFAEHLIETQGLGGDAIPDVLALGFSSLDLVGHQYGPNSREALDTVLRLDRTLGELLDFVDRRVGLDRVVVGLSGDHGVPPLPEFRERHGLSGTRAGAAEIVCLQQVGEQLAARFGEGPWLLPGPFLNTDRLERAGLAYATVERAAADLLGACPSVERVWTRSELLEDTSDTAAHDDLRPLFVNGFHPDRSPDLTLQFEPFFVPTRTTAATHGSAWPYDTWVPLVIRSAGLGAARVEQSVRSVDMAPTLAALAAITVPEGLDGVDLIGRVGMRAH